MVNSESGPSPRRGGIDALREKERLSSTEASLWEKGAVALLAAIERIARRMEPALRNAFLAAIRSAKSNMTLTLIERALYMRDPATAVRVATGGGLEFSRMRETLADIIEAAGIRATESLRRITGANLARFDITNPYAAAYARNDIGRLIRQISDKTLEGVRHTIYRAFQQGLAPRESARVIREFIGLSDYHVDMVLNHQFKLEIAGASDIEAKVARYAQKVLNRRALTIARTETLSAANAGQQTAWRAAIDQGFLPGDVEQQWIITDDERLCEICEPMHGQRRRMGHAFETGDGALVMKPPEPHPNCRCSLALVL